VIRRQEIDYQFYFIFINCTLTPPKKRKKKEKKVGLACRPNYTQDKA
jgi:hypothetical protein